jgi:hypothetical protein
MWVSDAQARTLAWRLWGTGWRPDWSAAAAPIQRWWQMRQLPRVPRVSHEWLRAHEIESWKHGGDP